MIRTLTESVREAKELVKAVDEFVKEMSKTKLSDYFKASLEQKDYYGEVSENDGTIIVTQEIRPGANVEVTYDNGEFIISFDGRTYRHKVGCVDKKSIEAKKKFSVVVIQARRCEDAGETEEPDQKSGEEGGE